MFDDDQGRALLPRLAARGSDSGRKIKIHFCPDCGRSTSRCVALEESDLANSAIAGLDTGPA
jgi:hypothetical protein